jgi:hypothetical protein
MPTPAAGPLSQTASFVSGMFRPYYNTLRGLSKRCGAKTLF